MSSLPPQPVHLVPPHSQPGGGTGGEIFQTEKIFRTPHLTSAATLESRSRSLHQSGALQAWKATYPYAIKTQGTARNALSRKLSCVFMA